MAEPTVRKISVADFNAMQDLVMVVDSTATFGDSSVVDAGDHIIANKDFDKFKKDDKVPFESIAKFFKDENAYKTVATPEEIVKIAQEYGLSISKQPREVNRCTCVQFAVVKDGEFIKDVFGENMHDPSINVAVLRHEFSKIKATLGFELTLPAEVAVRMAKHGAAYHSGTGRISLRYGKDQTLRDEQHPTQKAVFALGAAENEILLILTDDTGTVTYRIDLATGYFGPIEE